MYSMCGNCYCLARLALIVMFASVICSSVAIFSPWWSSNMVNGTVVYNSLLIKCSSESGQCLDIHTMWDRFQTRDFHKTLLGTLTLAMVGWIFSIGALIVMIIYACCPNKLTAMMCIVLSFLSGAMITGSVILYKMGLDKLIAAALSYSFAFDSAAGGLAFIAGVIAYVNSCLIP